jgi:hypothetical protein
MDIGDIGRRKGFRVSAIIFLCTCALTLDFLGILSLIDSIPSGVGDRIPFYLLAGAVGFVTALFYLEGEFTEGKQTILPALGIGVLVVAAVGLGVEGLLFAIRSPEKVLTENLLVYILSAGVISTGLGYWILQHWREFVGEPTA